MTESAPKISRYIRFGTVIVPRDAFVNARISEDGSMLKITTGTMDEGTFEEGVTVKTAHINPKHVDAIAAFVCKVMEDTEKFSGEWKPEWTAVKPAVPAPQQPRPSLPLWSK